MCKQESYMSVKRELAGYMNSKVKLAGLEKEQILASRKLLRAALVVCCIDEVLRRLDTDSQEYIRRRYLVDKPDKVLSIVMDMNMSQRTANRRNTEFLSGVSELLGQLCRCNICK